MKIINYYNKIKSIIGLSFVLAKAEFKLRNEGSYLGIIWYLLNPILMFGVLFFVFNDRLGNGIPYYPVYLLLGIIMFNFFQNTTIESVSSILKDSRWLIKSINFPREALVVSIVFKNLFSHFFEVLFFLLIVVFLKMALLPALCYFLILFLLCLFITGCSLLLASLTVYFVDLEGIWLFVSRLLWLGTPIFYAIEGQTKLYYVNLFNPMYYFLTLARSVVIFSKIPDGIILVGAIFYALLFFIVGMVAFNILKNKFAESI